MAGLNSEPDMASSPWASHMAMPGYALMPLVVGNVFGPMINLEFWRVYTTDYSGGLALSLSH